MRFMIALLAVVGGVSFAAAAPPNILMLISDDQAWSDYSFMGHPHIKTPHIDSLASESLAFRRGYVPSSLCRPSLASMITGLYPHQHQITSNDPPLPKGKVAANKDATFLAQRQEMIAKIDKVPTLPRLLAEQGYLSYQSGKWWEGNPSRGGFTDGMTHGDPKKGGRHGDVGLKIGREGVKEVTDFIDSAADQKKPFYVWYAPMMPHTPHNPPERLMKKYEGLTESKFVARYWAMCEWFDETCGALLDHLKEKGLADNTIVVYLCDNGWIQDPTSGAYAPRSKRSQYDGGLRTPIMFRWPGHIQPHMSDDLAITIDVVPTLLATVGQKPTPPMQGINLLDAEARKKRHTIYGEIFEHNAVDIHKPASSLDYRWVIDGNWKLIVPAAWNRPRAGMELYDLAKDPGEKENLAEKEPMKVAQLQKLLDAWWTPER